MTRAISLTIIALLLTYLPSSAQKKHKKYEILAIIDSVQAAWQTAHTYREDSWWDKAMYHTANMEAYRLTGNERYRQYSENWASHNKWMGAREPNKLRWKYERPMYQHDNVMFADWQICFQTYMDLYWLSPDSIKIKRALEVMNYQIGLPKRDFWYWCDALYMCMPVMTRLHKLTGNKIYLDKLYDWLTYTDQLMYDTVTGLYYRDAKFVYPKYKSPNGKKEFWSRGNGWVIAGLARVLADLPKDNEHYSFYLEKYRKMAYAVRDLQLEEGFWTQNIYDPDEMRDYETSGTGLFVYALAWGINNKMLPKKDFAQCVENGWEFLQTKSLLPDYRIGYVQDWGERAMPKLPITEKNQTNFGTGCFVLAAVEYCKFLKR